MIFSFATYNNTGTSFYSLVIYLVVYFAHIFKLSIEFKNKKPLCVPTLGPTRTGSNKAQLFQPTQTTVYYKQRLVYYPINLFIYLTRESNLVPVGFLTVQFQQKL